MAIALSVLRFKAFIFSNAHSKGKPQNSKLKVFLCSMVFNAIFKNLRKQN
jgi:hypothetical protein